ncbi:Adenylate cyclase, class 3 [Saccharicrinis carchari]|uniref:Adenylate cyclase, class 3 n=1 Tax=Saccharicrinis carchari TaxID=1168039 RepID=A0A521DUE6_SACCC|nr:adenylate/guanylate cyclase domain-containing protein [Saccharicrinis carchari]SMO74440.1 Adenylate cyclase, class 3 [Saccharicrinis carchari]
MTPSSLKILLVDDMAIILDIIILHLDTMNQDFTYLKANDGRSACKIAQQSKPDLILMDWEMPKMNGIDALMLMKKNESIKDIPVIIMSSFTDVRKALEAGAVDYIKKPIDPTELIARVQSAINLTQSFKALIEKQEELELERQKVERILKGLLPPKILEEIKETGNSKPKRYKNATVMFTDLVGFTAKTTSMSPKRLINELNDIFSSFDKIITKNRCTRIKTIGDAYLVASGLPEEDENHASNIIRAAIEFRQFILERNMLSSIKWEITTGINSGEIVGSLIGLENYLFDIFGENVNTASRIQHQCSPMDIAVSTSTYELTSEDFIFEKQGVVSLKGMNKMEIYNVMNVYSNLELSKVCKNFDLY